MLKSLPFAGTIKVINKGVDVTVLADRSSVDIAFAASRKLVVCGISTAVLNITCFNPIDTKTLAYYEETTPRMIAMNQQIFDAVQPHLRKTTRIALLDGTSEQALIDAVRTIACRNA